MWKPVARKQRGNIVFASVIIAMTGSTASLAGPGCMGNQQYTARGYSPAGVMGPPAMYRHGAPRVYHPAAMGGMIPPPHQRPMPARWGYPVAGPQPAGPVPVQTAPLQAGLRDAGTETTAGDRITVRIQGMRFEPATITVKPGTTVTWVHGSNMPHTVTGSADGLRSQTLSTGQSYSHTFDETGRFDYVCDFHPAMRGSVIVEAGGAGA